MRTEREELMKLLLEHGSPLLEEVSFLDKEELEKRVAAALMYTLLGSKCRDLDGLVTSLFLILSGVESIADATTLMQSSGADGHE